jgi:hypothetical protein
MNEGSAVRSLALVRQSCEAASSTVACTRRRRRGTARVWSARIDEGSPEQGCAAMLPQQTARLSDMPGGGCGDEAWLVGIARHAVTRGVTSLSDETVTSVRVQAMSNGC